jgi:LysM repeat protein
MRCAATDPLREGEMLLLPKRVAAAPQPAVIGGSTLASGSGVDITSIATTALDAAGPTPVAASPAASQPVSGQPLTHRVARGETAFTIARAYNVSAKALADWNQLGSDMAVREGQTLIIPIATAAAPDPEPVPTAPGAGTPDARAALGQEAPAGREDRGRRSQAQGDPALARPRGRGDRVVEDGDAGLGQDHPRL